MRKTCIMLGKKLAVMVMVSLLLIMNCQPVMAKENAERDVIAEFLEKKEAGLEVYELLDENGNIMGYYEPYSEMNPAPTTGIMPRYGMSIDWTIVAGTYTYGVNQYTLSSGMEMQINISQSCTGKSYLTFQNRDKGSSLRFNKTETTDGWNGKVVFAGIDTALYSFGIENASSDTITYTGTYEL